MHRTTDFAHFREPETVGDRVCNWLAYHPRWTCFAICLLCMSAGWLDSVLP